MGKFKIPWFCTNAPAYHRGRMDMGGFRHVDQPPQEHRPACLWASAAPIWFTATSKVIIFQKHAQIMSSQWLQLEVLTSKLRQRAWLIHPIAPATYWYTRPPLCKWNVELRWQVKHFSLFSHIIENHTLNFFWYVVSIFFFFKFQISNHVTTTIRESYCRAP